MTSSREGGWRKGHLLLEDNSIVITAAGGEGSKRFALLLSVPMLLKLVACSQVDAAGAA
jgi:hypothetical protein